jgi:hypothetical protein
MKTAKRLAKMIKYKKKRAEKMMRWLENAQRKK